MKRTQRIDALKNIKKRFVSFLSISIIIMFGIGGCFCTQYLCKGITETASEYYAEHNFMDYEVVSSMGITDLDIDTIKNLEEIADVEGAIALDGLLSKEGKLTDVKVMSLTQRINTVNLLEGKLPQNNNEVVLTSDLVEKLELKIGDEIKLNVTYDDKDPLNESNFKVVGIIQHPYYLKKHYTYCAVVTMDAFNKEVTNGLYTSAYVRTYDPITAETVESKGKDYETRDKIWNLTYDLQKQDIQYFKDLANQKIDEEWAKAETLFLDAEQQIKDNETELENQLLAAKKLLNEGKAQLAQGKAQLDAAQIEINNGEARLNEAKELIAKADPIFEVIKPNTVLNILNKALDLTTTLQKRLVDNNQELIDKARNNLTEWLASEEVNNALNKAEELTGLPIISTIQKAIDTDILSEAISYINKGIELINQYNEYRPKISEYEQQIANGKAQIAEGLNEYNKGLAELNAKEKEMKDKETEARAQIADAKVKLAEAKEDAIKKVELARKEAENLDVNLIVTARSGNVGFVDIANQIDIVKSAGLVFGVLFLFITALVCFSTLAIMVEEDKKQVGTTKAFGFYNNEILMKYIYYGVGAAIIGSILGVGLAYGLARFVNIQLAKTGQYGFGLAKTSIAVYETIAVVLLVIFVCAITTIISCYVLMKTPASLLLKDETISSRNKKLKKKKDVKNNGSLYSHLIFKNMLDEKARVFVTILIVAVSLSIIGIGITLKLAFDGMFEKQIYEVYNYDYRVAYTDEVNEDMTNEMKKYFDDNNISYLEATYEARLYNDNNDVDAFYVIAADGDKIGEYFTIKDPDTNEIITLPDDGMIVQNKFIETKGMTPGKTLRVLDNTLAYHEATVAGNFENYQGRLVLLSTEAYRNIFTEKPTYNCFYIKLNDADSEKLINAFSNISKDISFEARDDFSSKFSSLKSLYNLVVYILTTMAIVMSFMIITNLANIFVTRKKKELIVMRINGFSIKQTIAYLARETVITVIIGLVVGLICGYFLGIVAVNVMEPYEARFDHSFKPIAWIIAFVVEAFFAFLINFLSFRKVKDLNFRDITS